jgi:iron complex outermembrane receptor protein
MAAIPSVAEELGDTSKVHDLDEVTVVSQPKEVFRLRLQPVSSTMLSRQTINFA